MSSSRSMAGSSLDGSWVVNDLDSSDADLDEAVVPPRKTQSPQKTHLPSAAQRRPPRRRSSRASSAVPEPELVMPSIHENMDGSWAGQEISEPAYPQARKRNTKAAKSRKVESAKSPTLMQSSSARSNVQQAKSAEIGPYILTLLAHTGEWLLDIAGGTLKALKRPIIWVLTIYVFAGLFTVMQNFLFNSMYTALTPICRIPGASLLNLPFCTPSSDVPSIDPHAHAEFDELMRVQSQFEELMDQSAAGVSLPMDMKRSETSVRDLRQVVKWSSLHSKNELVFEFDGIIETARIASYDLQKFNAHVGRAVDMVLSSTRWTQRVLDDMALTQSSRSQRILPAFISDKILAPFQPLQFNEDRLLDQYLRHTNAVSGEIDRLLDEAQALLMTLKNLEDRLDVIHGIALRDNIHAQGSKDEVLSQLWTLLGGNRAKLGRFNEQLRLLRQVGEQRKVAWAHVSGAILKLQAMGAELEELRERVGSADLLKDHPEVPLAVHLETIRLGVERLEQGRVAARELERGHIRRTLDSAERDEKTFVLDGDPPRIGR